MVAQDRTVKIGDFGLSRDMHAYEVRVAGVRG